MMAEETYMYVEIDVREGVVGVAILDRGNKSFAPSCFHYYLERGLRDQTQFLLREMFVNINSSIYCMYDPGHKTHHSSQCSRCAA